MVTENLELLKKYLECAGRSLQEKPVRAEAPKRFVTISRQTGAGGLTVAAKLADYLNGHDRVGACPWAALDKVLVQKTLEEHRLPEHVAKYMHEDVISEIADTMEDLFGLHPSQWTLVHRMSETLLNLAKMGSVILIGRAANVVTRKLPGGLHVRIVAPLDKRLAHTREYYGLSAGDAGRFIREEDAGREHYLKKNFGRRIDDEMMYDLTINTASISYDEAARIIGEVVFGIRREASAVPAAL